MTDGRPWEGIRSAVVSITLNSRQAVIAYQLDRLPEVSQRGLDLRPGASLRQDGEHLILTMTGALQQRADPMRITGPEGKAAICKTDRDASLVKALAKAEAWRRRLVSGASPTLASIAAAEGLAVAYVQRVARLAFLAPDLKRAILDGRQPANLAMDRFMRQDLPLAWEDQRQLFRGRQP